MNFQRLIVVAVVSVLIVAAWIETHATPTPDFSIYLEAHEALYARR